MGLFILSFIMVFLSSYFITCIFTPKKSILGLIYIFLIAFAQIVLTFETLSLFSAINQFGVLLVNVIFLILSTKLWIKKLKPIWKLDYTSFRKRLLNSFKLDKSLAVLYVGFCVFIVSSIFLCLIMPITNLDAMAYHAARSLFWIFNGNLNHFEVSDIRNVCLPINSEILYSWVLMFMKKDVFLGFFSFVGYILTIISTCGILGLLGYGTRKKLWVVFILSSFSSVIVQVSGTETDIIIAGLVSSSIFLYWLALKKDEKIPLFMSALSYALAIGTKTPVLMATPGVGLFLLALSIYLKKKDFYKPMLIFLGFGIISFIIFASYNYILNFIEFHNFMSSESFMQVSKNYYGIKAIPANFIKYIFMLFDFTGFKWGDYIGLHLLHARNVILNYLHLAYIKDGIYTMNVGVNRTLLEPVMGAGILGFLVYLPCLFWSFIKPVLKPKHHNTWIIFGFATLFIINLLVMSYSLAFMTFSVRFIMFFMALSAPILVYSYMSNKNPLKYVIIAFAMFYMTCVSTHLWARPIVKILPILLKTKSIEVLRQKAKCGDYQDEMIMKNDACLLARQIRRAISTENKIVFFPTATDNIYIIKALEFEGYKIDFRNMENMKNIDLSKYNVIITRNEGQKSTLIKDYDRRKDEYKFKGKKIIISRTNKVPCLYSSNPFLPKPKDGHRLPPYNVQCFMTQQFMRENNLQMIGISGNIDPTSKERFYYTLYQNGKSPIIYK